MARDVSIRLHRCQYCNRPGFVVWDTDLFTCGEEMCKTLAFAEIRRRHHGSPRELPEQRLARALLAAFDTFDYAVRLDERAELVDEREATRIRGRERERTALLLSELRALTKRYPPIPQPPQLEAPSPRHRRFVGPGRTVPLRRDRRPSRGRRPLAGGAVS